MKNPTTITKYAFNLMLILISTLAFSTNSLAKLNAQDKINSVEVYPYNLLIQRTDQIKVIYQGEQQITCRVEILKDELQWSGDTQVVKADKFKQNPLRHCLDRDHAKQILASTF